MGRLVSVFSTMLALAPAVAMAQPGSPDPAPPPAPPPPAPTSAPPANPYPPTNPYPPSNPYPPQQGYPQQGYPQQGYPQQGPNQQPYAQQNPPRATRDGATFEANIGFGLISSEGESENGLGFALGAGAWISPRTAVTARLQAVTMSESGVRLTSAFLGPSLQYWVADNVWLGGGAGLAIAAASYEGEGDSVNGFALNLRGGFTFSTATENTFNVSLELSPGFYDEGDLTNFALMFGYQHL